MHLKKLKRNGRIYLSVVQNYRENGRTKTKTIETIGYADAYENEFADPLEHFEEYVARLNEERKAAVCPISFSFPRHCTIDKNRTESARWGAGIALAYLNALEAGDAIASNKDACGSGAQAHRVFELFATERVLHATPKRETWERKGSFPRVCDFTLAEAYKALPLIAERDEAAARRMRASYERIRPDHAPLECAYVILETFAFADTDDVDTTNDARQTKGRLAVSLAMVLDENGMPAEYRLIGANPDASAIRDLIADLKSSLHARRVVVVAGRLEHAESIMAELIESGDGFIMHRNLEEAVEDMRHWVADEQGYTTSHSGNYRIKSRVRTMRCRQRAHVRDILLWGRDYAQRSKAKHKSQGDDQALSGYACIVTSETSMPAADVFHLYRELWRLVEPFQVLESDFSPSPYPTSREDHIRAHFIICYAAFFALRLMRSDLGWRYNAAQVAEALVRMEGSHLAENWFLFGYRSDVTDAIENAAGADAALRLRTKQDIRYGIARAQRHITKER